MTGTGLIARLRAWSLGRPLWHYLGLTLALAVLPVALVAAALLLIQATEQRVRLEQALATTARTLSVAVDREVRSYEVLLRTLSESESLHDGDLKRFYEIAARVAKENGAIFISVFSADGRQLLNTALPYGAKLPQPFEFDATTVPANADEPPIADVSPQKRVIAGARASNSNLYRSLATGKLLLNVNVPVMRDGRLRYLLNVGLEPAVLQELLLSPSSGRHALDVIIDANDFIIARGDGQGGSIGTRAGNVYRAARARSGSFVTTGTARDGKQVMFAAHTSPVTGWTSVASVQGEQLFAETQRIWIVGALATVASLVAGSALAWYLGRRLNASMRSLVEVASGGQAHTRDAIPAAEIIALRNALLRARANEQEAAAERERTAAARARQAELEQMAREKDRFIATVSHELRNPLGVIRNATSLLRRGGQRDDVLPVLERQTAHLTRLIDDLLDLSRLVQGKMRFEFETLDLRAVLKEAVELVQPRLDQQRQQVDIDQPGDPVRVRADPVRLRQSIMNLLDNAAKYSPAQSRIAVALGADGGKARLTIRDQGPGVDPARVDRMFEPFVQLAEPGSKATEGLGLGLPLARELLQLQGGRMSVRNVSEQGGFEVTIELPLVDAARA